MSEYVTIVAVDLGALASFMHKAVVDILSGSLLVDVHFQVFG